MTSSVTFREQEQDPSNSVTRKVAVGICSAAVLLLVQLFAMDVTPAGAVGISACDATEICMWSSVTGTGGPQGSYTDWTPTDANYSGDPDLSNNPYEIVEPGFATMMGNSISFVYNRTPDCYAFYAGTGYTDFVVRIGPDQIVALPLHDPNWNNVVSSFENEGLCQQQP